MLRTMFYVKNVPTLERVARVTLGIILVAGAIIVFAQPTADILVRGLAVVGVASGIFAVVTGFVGWCPACALVGRKLTPKQRAQ